MRTGLSVALVAAIAAAAITDPMPCPACANPANAGLCHSDRCEREVLPQVKEPSWYRDAHSGMYHETGKAQLEDDAATRKARRREDRKRQRARARIANEMVQGPFTRSRHSVA